MMDDIYRLNSLLISLHSASLLKEYKHTLFSIDQECDKFRNPRRIKYLLKPYFYSEDDWKKYSYLTKTLISIAKKVVNAYLTDFRIQRFYDLPAMMHKLIMSVPPDQCVLPCVRLDLFFRESQPLLCEVNCDGSAGMRKDMVVNDSLLSLSSYQDLSQHYKLSYKNLISAQVNTYIRIYREHPSSLIRTKNRIPIVAIVNYRENNDFQENMLYVQEYNKHGIEAVLVDPREFIYHNNTLYFNGRAIDFIQKEVLDFKLLEHRNDSSDFLEAMLDEKICFIGSALGNLIDDKAFFALMHSGLIDNLLTSAEKAFIKRYVPITHLCRSDESLYNLAIIKKDYYILKSRDTYGGIGVISGKTVSDEEWALIVSSAWNSNYVIQEFIETDLDQYPYVSNGAVTYDDFRITIGLFCYDGVLSGLYSRASKEVLVNDYGPNDYYLGNLFYETKS